MQQAELFHETWENALQATVDAIGGPKKVAAELWPGMKLDSAYAKLKACLDPDKEREKFSLSEIVTLTNWGRKKGIHYSNAFFNDDTGYERPKPIAREQRKAEAIEDVKLIAEQLAGAIAVLDGLAE